MTKGRRGRANARIELGFAGFLVFVVQPLVFMSAPAMMSPMFGPDDTTALGMELIPFAGLAIQLIALAWMVRIYRADPEPDQGAWRYRAAR